ncbi:tfiih [Anaeramoeba flamelloides]|uniref:General transcription factor IIH subunit 4 n=1 Tax=Anaeramoeba flamelloides TaxID=1746091 RepID=A0ABQ8XXB2_9EUKA|nr:tfiih [Anaeramoeba flamelloides]
MEGGFLDYLVTLKREEIYDLYRQSFVCEIVFRTLPVLSKQYVCRLLAIPPPGLELTLFEDCLTKEGKKEHDGALKKLHSLSIIESQKKGFICLNKIFQSQIRKIVTGSFVDEQLVQSFRLFGKEIQKTSKHSKKCWERIMFYLIKKLPHKNPLGKSTYPIHDLDDNSNSSSNSNNNSNNLILKKDLDRKRNRNEMKKNTLKSNKKKSSTSSTNKNHKKRINAQDKPELIKNQFQKTIVPLLKEAGLLTLTKKKEYRTTKEGFRFLFKNKHQQIWTILLQYISDCKRHHLEKSFVTSFLFRLGFSDLNKGTFLPLGMDDKQKKFILNLHILGFICLSGHWKIYYPTPLTKYISKTDSKISQHGNIVLETNFKTYIYSSDLLDLCIFSFFVKLQHQLPNLATGIITKKKIRKAFKMGLTAELLIQYIEHLAHPKMFLKFPIIPPTVSEQFHHWEAEKNRLSFDLSTVYQNFESKNQYHAILKVALENNIELWHSDQNEIIAIKQSGEDIIVKEIQKTRDSML